MKPEDYPIFRDRLVSLFRSLLSLEVLDEPDRHSLSRLLDKVARGRFRFVLAGEFQCGKSTTFNALCDGRDLSPRGSGLKTSGCVITALPLPDPREAEHASVLWRRAGELSDGIIDLLYPRLARLAPRRFDAGGTRPLLDLNEPADRDLLSAAVREEWAEWRRDRAGYDLRGKGRLDTLRCATVIGRYWDHDQLNRLRTRKRFSLSEVKRFMTFPADWETRWITEDPDPFSALETAFIFIREIRLHLHSPQLSRLGCGVVDCPGLFASRWDTRTARAAMAGADAILYLFDGSRPLKRSDLRALTFIRENDMTRNLFYGCNLRGLSAADSDRVLDASLLSLRQEGVDVPPERVVAYHARLGLAALQAERRLQEAGGASGSDESVRPLLDDLRRMISLLNGAEPDAGEALSAADLIASARRASGLDRLMAMAEGAAVRRRASAILIDNGARIGLDILRKVTGTLQYRETAVRSEAKSFKDRIAAAETALRRFEGDSRLAIDRLQDASPDPALADDLWSRLVAARDPLCDACAERIRKEVLTRRRLPALAVRRKSVEDDIVRILKSEMETRFEAIVHGWLAEVAEGRNPVYNLRIARQVETVGRELNGLWRRSGLEEMRLLSGVTLPSFSGIPAVERDRLFREMADREILDDLRDHAVTAASLAGIFTAASGLLAGVLGAMSRVFWAAVASAAVLLVNGLILLLARGMVKETLTSEIRSRLSPAFIQIFDEIEPEIRSAFSGFSAEIRTLYRDAFLAAVEQPRGLFEERRRQAEEDFRRHREERDAIGREARRLRRERVEPLLLALEQFISEVNAALSAE